MKVFFNYECTGKELYFDKVICFHGCIDNQNILYDVFLDGLNGADKSFMLNNSSVKKKELNVIEFSSNSILDDLKMTSKSYNLKILDEFISDDNEEEILEQINYLLQGLRNKVVSKYDDLLKEESLLNPQILFDSPKELVVNNFKLVSKDMLNVSSEIELQLKLIIHYISMHKNKDFYLLIKHFDHCLDIDQMMGILKKISNISNLFVFIFSKSFELFESTFSMNIPNYMIKEHEISKLFVDENYEYDIHTYLTEEELCRFKFVNEMVTRYQLYRRIVSENFKKSEIIDDL